MQKIKDFCNSNSNFNIETDKKILNDTNYITDVEEIQRRIKVLNQEIKKTLEEDLEKAKKRKKELEDKLANTHICYTCKQEIQNETMIKNIERIDRKELENGVILYGKENLNSYIENFE